MTVGKATLLAAGLVGVVALGVVTGPTIRDKWSTATAPTSTATSAPVEAAPTPVKTERPAARRMAASTAGKAPIAIRKVAPGTVQTVAVSLWEPELRQRVKAVLNEGSKPEIAAADFANAEQFMTVAHAAHNTKVPFMVLKHRVLNQGQPLDAAIHELKPSVDAKAEVERAHEAARADLDIAN